MVIVSTLVLMVAISDSDREAELLASEPYIIYRIFSCFSCSYISINLRLSPSNLCFSFYKLSSLNYTALQSPSAFRRSRWASSFSFLVSSSIALNFWFSWRRISLPFIWTWVIAILPNLYINLKYLLYTPMKKFVLNSHQFYKNIFPNSAHYLFISKLMKLSLKLSILSPEIFHPSRLGHFLFELVDLKTFGKAQKATLLDSYFHCFSHSNQKIQELLWSEDSIAFFLSDKEIQKRNYQSPENFF